jgi:DNA-binding beta-propeller fold protein YncE
MRSVLLAASLIVLPLPALTQTAADIPVVHYKAVPDWPPPLKGDKHLPAGPWNYWQVSGVAVEKNGNILVMHRGDDPILEYKPNGDFIGPWGEVKFDHGKVMVLTKSDRASVPNMSGYQAIYGIGGCSNCGAHQLRVDPAGNVWAVDAPAHVIYKMNPAGHVVMTLGTKGKPGMTDHNFYMPTDIAFAPNGELIVTDGYGNARIMRFSADGRLLGQFGRRGNGPGEFQLPHSVVVDRQGRIYVSDRDNERVEVFDGSGKFLAEWPHVGALSNLTITADQKIWAGGVLRDLDGKAIERLPGEGANARAHGGAIAANGDIYLGLLSGTVEKFVRQ